MFCSGGQSRSYQVPSGKMDKEVPATLILPNAYSKNEKQRFPVLYLLHGAGGNHASWNQSTQCAQLADQYEFIILCPDGGSTSWYYDSPNRSGLSIRDPCGRGVRAIHGQELSYPSKPWFPGNLRNEYGRAWCDVPGDSSPRNFRYARYV